MDPETASQILLHDPASRYCVPILLESAATKYIQSLPNTHPSLTTKFTSEQTAIATPFAAK
jgi:hypothetical protein